jgi:hypothetical protein
VADSLFGVSTLAVVVILLGQKHVSIPSWFVSSGLISFFGKLNNPRVVKRDIIALFRLDPAPLILHIYWFSDTSGLVL